MSLSRTEQAISVPLFADKGNVAKSGLYVERRCDSQLTQFLINGELAYILGPRQIGKSSLIWRAREVLQQHQRRCAVIDMQGLSASTEEQWYYSITEMLAEQLGIEAIFSSNWPRNSRADPAVRWSQFVRKEVVARFNQVVLFFDEIDSVLQLGNSRCSTFFASLRSIYEESKARHGKGRITMCLVGVAAHKDLIQDKERTPFNIATEVRMHDFTRLECDPFANHLIELGCSMGHTVMDEVYDWTAGHPYMTQRVCKELSQPQSIAALQQGSLIPETVNQLIEKLFLHSGMNDDPNLAETNRRFTKHVVDEPIQEMLSVYHRIRLRANNKELLEFNGNDDLHLRLLLSGIAAERIVEEKRMLCVRNKIFRYVFDDPWIAQVMPHHGLDGAVRHWIEAGRSKDRLLRGKDLQKAKEWAGKHVPSKDEDDLLRESVLEEKWQNRFRWGLAVMSLVLIFLICLALLLYQQYRRTRAAELTRESALVKLRQTIHEKDQVLVEKEKIRVRTERIYQNLWSSLQEVATARAEAVALSPEEMQRLQGQLLAVGNGKAKYPPLRGPDASSGPIFSNSQTMVQQLADGRRFHIEKGNRQLAEAYRQLIGLEAKQACHEALLSAGDGLRHLEEQVRTLVVERQWKQALPLAECLHFMNMIIYGLRSQAGARYLDLLAQISYHNGLYEDEKIYAERALVERKDLLGDSIETARARDRLAIVYVRSGRRPLIEMAIDNYEKSISEKRRIYNQIKGRGKDSRILQAEIERTELARKSASVLLQGLP